MERFGKIAIPLVVVVVSITLIFFLVAYIVNRLVI